MTNAGTERGRRLARTERHQLIVDAAVRVFERRGTIAVTYEEIADEAGISRALVYNYFADRGALLEAVCQRNAKVLDHDVAVALTTTRGRREALAASMRAHLAMARRQPVAYRQASGDPALGAPRSREQVMVASTETVRISMYQTEVDRHASEAVTLQRLPCDGGVKVVGWCVIGPPGR